MTMPSEPALTIAADAERRLHPWSWLFVLIQQLRQFALPLLVLLFTGRGSRYELWGLAGAGVLVLVSLAQYFTYRYRLDRDGIVIRSGLLQKSLRHIPYQRIHNVALHQSLLHRLMGVAEVRLESAGGAKPEGQMRVLALADAQALEAQIRQRGRVASQAEDPGSAPTPLLTLDSGEVVRLGLISNRGLIVVAAAVGALAQAGDGLLGRVLDASRIEAVVRWALGWGQEQPFALAGAIAGALALFLLALVLLRLLSVALALLQFHGFVLDEQAGRLSVQRGLLTRLRSSLPRRRIQAWTLHEGLLHRWLGRQSLRVDSAALEVDLQRSTLRDLAPLATPEAMSTLIRHLLPGRPWPLTRWRPLHPRAWRRQLTGPAGFALLLTGALAWRFGVAGLAALALLPLFAWRARLWARHAGYACEGGLVAVREGWLDKYWRYAEVSRLQALRLSQSPFDRRHGMATLWLDSAGAGASEPPLRLRYLPEAEARALYAQLAAAMA